MELRKKWETMILLSLILMCLLNLLIRGASSQQIPEQSTGVLLDKDTDKRTAYSIEIMDYHVIESDYIKNWADEKKNHGRVNGQPVYYTLYNDEFDAPMDMYLYMPLIREAAGGIALSDIRVNESGKALVLNIDTDKKAVRAEQDEDVILHVYVSGAPENAMAKTDRLIINGERYDCPGATFTHLSD